MGEAQLSEKQKQTLSNTNDNLKAQMQRSRTIVFPDLSPQRMSSPTCEELGIPHNSLDPVIGIINQCHPHHRQDASPFQQDSLLPSCQVFTDVSNDSSRTTRTISGPSSPVEKDNDPFSPSCLIPLPDQMIDFECGFEPAFIRKRNERERERVRCVNEGYARLKKHLPIPQQEKRISKVETLRAAIQYIRSLQELLQASNTKKKIDPKLDSWSTSNTEHAHSYKSYRRKR